MKKGKVESIEYRGNNISSNAPQKSPTGTCGDDFTHAPEGHAHKGVDEWPSVQGSARRNPESGDAMGVSSWSFTYGIAHWKKRHAFFIKCVSLILAILFFDQQIGWAQAGKPVWAQAKSFQIQNDKLDTNGIDIPYDIAETTEVLSNGGDEVIINIQDAHASLAAQESITSLLNSLVTNYDLNLIAIEGASGFVDTSLLKTFPDKEIRDDVASALVQEGRMGAGEFFAITHDAREIDLYGIEDKELYQENLRSFREVALERAIHVENINKLLGQLEALDEKVSSGELRNLNRNCMMHREGSLSFVDYWGYLGSLAEKHKVDVSGYGELAKILSTVKLEKSIDFSEANNERRQLIDQLSKEMDKEELEELVLKSLSFKQNKISQANFHAYLIGLAEKHGVAADDYENLIKFARYVAIYESIELFKLYRQIEEFEESIREKLYRNGEEREIFRLTRIVRLLKQLYSVELNNSEYVFVEANYKNFNAGKTAAFIREAAKKYQLPLSGGYDLASVLGKEDIEKALKFYRDAQARDHAMLTNTIKRMRKDGTHAAALITGGYHTKGLTELMRKNKLSYLVVIPKFDSGKERPYIAILTNKKKPYEKILASGKYKLAVEAIFQDKLDKVSQRELFTEIYDRGMEGVKRTRQRQSLRNLWQDAYKTRYERLLRERGEEDMAKKMTPEEFNAFMAERAEGEEEEVAQSVEERLERLEKAIGIEEIGLREVGEFLGGLNIPELAAQLTKVSDEKILALLQAKGLKLPANWREQEDIRSAVNAYIAEIKHAKKLALAKEKDEDKKGGPSAGAKDGIGAGGRPKEIIKEEAEPEKKKPAGPDTTHRMAAWTLLAAIAAAGLVPTVYNTIVVALPLTMPLWIPFIAVILALTVEIAVKTPNVADMIRHSITTISEYFREDNRIRRSLLRALSNAGTDYDRILPKGEARVAYLKKIDNETINIEEAKQLRQVLRFLEDPETAIVEAIRDEEYRQLLYDYLETIRILNKAGIEDAYLTRLHTPSYFKKIVLGQSFEDFIERVTTLNRYRVPLKPDLLTRSVEYVEERARLVNEYGLPLTDVTLRYTEKQVITKAVENHVTTLNEQKMASKDRERLVYLVLKLVKNAARNEIANDADLYGDKQGADLVRRGEHAGLEVVLEKLDEISNLEEMTTPGKLNDQITSQLAPHEGKLLAHTVQQFVFTVHDAIKDSGLNALLDNGFLAKIKTQELGAERFRADLAHVFTRLQVGDLKEHLAIDRTSKGGGNLTKQEVEEFKRLSEWRTRDSEEKELAGVYLYRLFRTEQGYEEFEKLVSPEVIDAITAKDDAEFEALVKGLGYWPYLREGQERIARLLREQTVEYDKGYELIDRGHAKVFEYALTRDKTVINELFEIACEDASDSIPYKQKVAVFANWQDEYVLSFMGVPFFREGDVRKAALTVLKRENRAKTLKGADKIRKAGDITDAIIKQLLSDEEMREELFEEAQVLAQTEDKSKNIEEDPIHVGVTRAFLGKEGLKTFFDIHFALLNLYPQARYHTRIVYPTDIGVVEKGLNMLESVKTQSVRKWKSIISTKISQVVPAPYRPLVTGTVLALVILLILPALGLFAAQGGTTDIDGDGALDLGAPALGADVPVFSQALYQDITALGENSRNIAEGILAVEQPVFPFQTGDMLAQAVIPEAGQTDQSEVKELKVERYIDLALQMNVPEDFARNWAKGKPLEKLEEAVDLGNKLVTAKKEYMQILKGRGIDEDKAEEFIFEAIGGTDARTGQTKLEKINQLVEAEKVREGSEFKDLSAEYLDVAAKTNTPTANFERWLNRPGRTLSDLRDAIKLGKEIVKARDAYVELLVAGGMARDEALTKAMVTILGEDKLEQIAAAVKAEEEKQQIAAAEAEKERQAKIAAEKAEKERQAILAEEEAQRNYLTSEPINPPFNKELNNMLNAIGIERDPAGYVISTFTDSKYAPEKLRGKTIIASKNSPETPVFHIYYGKTDKDTRYIHFTQEEAFNTPFTTYSFEKGLKANVDFEGTQFIEYQFDAWGKQTIKTWLYRNSKTGHIDYYAGFASGRTNEVYLGNYKNGNPYERFRFRGSYDMRSLGTAGMELVNVWGYDDEGNQRPTKFMPGIAVMPQEELAKFVKTDREKKRGGKTVAAGKRGTILITASMTTTETGSKDDGLGTLTGGETGKSVTITPLDAEATDTVNKILTAVGSSKEAKRGEYVTAEFDSEQTFGAWKGNTIIASKDNPGKPLLFVTSGKTSAENTYLHIAKTASYSGPVTYYDSQGRALRVNEKFQGEVVVCHEYDVDGGYQGTASIFRNRQGQIEYSNSKRSSEPGSIFFEDYINGKLVSRHQLKGDFKKTERLKEKGAKLVKTEVYDSNGNISSVSNQTEEVELPGEELAKSDRFHQEKKALAAISPEERGTYPYAKELYENLFKYIDEETGKELRRDIKVIDINNILATSLKLAKLNNPKLTPSEEKAFLRGINLLFTYAMNGHAKGAIDLNRHKAFVQYEQYARDPEHPTTAHNIKRANNGAFLRAFGIAIHCNLTEVYGDHPIKYSEKGAPSDEATIVEWNAIMKMAKPNSGPLSRVDENRIANQIKALLAQETAAAPGGEHLEDEHLIKASSLFAGWGVHPGENQIDEAILMKVEAVRRLKGLTPEQMEKLAILGRQLRPIAPMFYDVLESQAQVRHSNEMLRAILKRYIQAEKCRNSGLRRRKNEENGQPDRVTKKARLCAI